VHAEQRVAVEIDALDIPFDCRRRQSRPEAKPHVDVFEGDQMREIRTARIRAQALHRNGRYLHLTRHYSPP